MSEIASSGCCEARVIVQRVQIYGREAAMRGMRYPLQSNAKNDSTDTRIGPNDLNLLTSLTKAGKSHRKALRQIIIGCDITAPQYFWREYNTYKVATVENSTSQMHTILKKMLSVSDFVFDKSDKYAVSAFEAFISEINSMILICNNLIQKNDPSYIHVWRNIIQMIPQSFKYTKYCTLNYEVLKTMYEDRKFHKLFEWSEFLSAMVSNIPEDERVLITDAKFISPTPQS